MSCATIFSDLVAECWLGTDLESLLQDKSDWTTLLGKMNEVFFKQVTDPQGRVDIQRYTLLGVLGLDTPAFLQILNQLYEVCKHR